MIISMNRPFIRGITAVLSLQLCIFSCTAAYATAVEEDIGYTNISAYMNADRQLLEERFLDADGKLAENEKGYAVEKDEYDEEGNLIRRSFYDA